MKTFKTPKGTELPVLLLQGKDYLTVNQRLVWFREEHPDWTIKTEIIESFVALKLFIVKAFVYTEKEVLLSTAYKCAPLGEDNLEKAETGAIGRALAFIGYGTQFMGDELTEGTALADAPVQAKANGGTNPTCCFKPMIVSKYDESKFYCLSCKKTKPRIDVNTLFQAASANLNQDVPF